MEKTRSLPWWAPSLVREQLITGHCEEDHTYWEQAGWKEGSTLDMQWEQSSAEEEKAYDCPGPWGQDKILFTPVFSEAGT